MEMAIDSSPRPVTQRSPSRPRRRDSRPPRTQRRPGHLATARLGAMSGDLIRTAQALVFRNGFSPQEIAVGFSGSVSSDYPEAVARMGQLSQQRAHVVVQLGANDPEALGYVVMARNWNQSLERPLAPAISPAHLLGRASVDESQAGTVYRWDADEELTHLAGAPRIGGYVRPMTATTIDAGVIAGLTDAWPLPPLARVRGLQHAELNIAFLQQLPNVDVDDGRFLRVEIERSLNDGGTFRDHGFIWSYQGVPLARFDRLAVLA